MIVGRPLENLYTIEHAGSRVELTREQALLTVALLGKFLGLEETKPIYKAIMDKDTQCAS